MDIFFKKKFIKSLRNRNKGVNLLYINNNTKFKTMKTELREKFTLETLNAKSDNGIFSHRMLRAKLIAEKHYSPIKHKKGKMYLLDGMLWCAYNNNYAPIV